MRRIISILTLILLIFTLYSCEKNIELDDTYDENTFGYIDIGKDEIKIMQLTDLHFTYGFDSFDRKTYKLLDALVEQENPDLIVLTGDVFMSIYAKRILKKFIKHMESYNIPWAYAFGNHEREYHQMEEIVSILMNANTNNLYFHYGPKLSLDKSHGYSNYKLKITNGATPLLNVYILDSKANRTDGVVDEDYPYDYFSTEQVDWFRDNL